MESSGEGSSVSRFKLYGLGSWDRSLFLLGFMLKESPKIALLRLRESTRACHEERFLDNANGTKYGDCSIWACDGRRVIFLQRSV